MSTRTTRGPRLTIEEVQRILDGPLELVIDDAVSYWLEDNAGDHLSEEATTTKGPFACALELHELGREPDRMLLVARLDTGERYEVGGGLPLIDMAEAAAWIPARPRIPPRPGGRR